MKITDVKIKKIEKEDSKLKGVCSIIIDDNLAIHDIKIVEGTKGLFIAMPSKKNLNGEYKDIIHPINAETRKEIENKILDKYMLNIDESKGEKGNEDFNN